MTLVDDFERDGFLVVPSVLDHKTMAFYRSEYERIERKTSGSKASLDVTREPEGTIFILGDPTRFSPHFASLIASEHIVSYLQVLLGAGRITCHFSNVTAKAANGNREIRWHRDFPNDYITTRDPSWIRVMVCLDGMSKENGATVFIPGSHKWEPRSDVHDAFSTDEGLDSNAGWFQVDGSVPAVCPSGSLVFIHPLVLHGGPANTSRKPRRNVISEWSRDVVIQMNGAQPELLTGKRPDVIRSLATESV